MKLEDKRIVVTGGASGLGLATVEALARLGAQVVILDVNQTSIANALEKLSSKGLSAHHVTGDIVGKQAALQLMKEAAGKLTRLDGLVNCAGVYPRRALLEISDDDWDYDWKVNVRGTYNTMAAAVEIMRPQPVIGKVRGR